jgi:hypothetical protein
MSDPVTTDPVPPPATPPTPPAAPPATPPATPPVTPPATPPPAPPAVPPAVPSAVPPVTPPVTPPPVTPPAVPPAPPVDPAAALKVENETLKSEITRLNGLLGQAAKTPSSPTPTAVTCPARAGSCAFARTRARSGSATNGAKLRGYCHLNRNLNLNPNLDLNLLMENEL